MAEYPTITLNTGAKMPLIGIGTFLAEPGEVGAAVTCALKSGYKHVDCAAVYNNEKEIGEAFAAFFADPNNKREDYFITSKLAADSIDPKKVEEGLKKTLADLQLEYLDLYLIHQSIPVMPDPTYDGKHRIIGKFKPVRGQGWGMQDVWRSMEACYEKGLAKAIGVSNWNCQLMNDVLNYAKVLPAVNQIERHPYFQQTEFIKFLQANNVVVTAYAPLGATGLYSGQEKPLLQHETLTAIAEAHKKTVAQVLIRWAMDSNTVVIPKSQKPHRVAENFDVLDFKLTEEDMGKIAGLEQGGRLFGQDWMGVPSFK